MAFMMPTMSRPISESGLYSVCVAMPMAWPSGVLWGAVRCVYRMGGGGWCGAYVQPYASAMIHGW